MLRVRQVDVYTVGGGHGTVLRRLRSLKMLRVSTTRLSPRLGAVSAVGTQLVFRGGTSLYSRTVRVLSRFSGRGRSVLTSLTKGPLVKEGRRRRTVQSRRRVLEATERVRKCQGGLARGGTTTIGVRRRRTTLTP